MALAVGVDSYVTLEEANSILSKCYTSNNEVYLKWLALSPEDKEVMLRTSCRSINNLKFDGKRQVVGQKMEFPRVFVYSVGIAWTPYVSPFYDNGLVDGSYNGDGGIGLVKEAQCENAIWNCFLDDTVNKQVGINIKGLVSKKAGPIAETYNTDNKYNRDAINGIYTSKVYSLLTPWLNDARATV
jgi:hypothetical protein